MSELDLSFLEGFEVSASNSSSESAEELREASTRSKWIVPESKEKMTPEELEKRLFEKEKRELKNARKKAQEIQLQYAKNISNSSEYRSALCKGIQEGAPVIDLFLLACNCISDLTGDIAFFETIKKSLNK